MLAEERRQIILDILEKEGRVIAKELSEMFQMSVDSIRRDLTIMEEQGLLQKTYGGAISIIPKSKVRTMPQPEEIRYGDGAPHQNAISRLATTYIKEHDTVYIGGAGIHYGMLKYLPTEIPFTVVTNSLKIADFIRKRENITAYLIGGKLQGDSSRSINDTLAIEMMSKFTLDIGFITGGGISINGISTATPEAAAFTQKVTQVSRKIICLAPHEKLGQQMFISSTPIERVHLLITDQGAPETVIQEIRKKNIEVIFADEGIES